MKRGLNTGPRVALRLHGADCAKARGIHTDCAKAQSGFTLLEIVVVVAIFGVLSLMAYGGLNNVLKSRQHIEQFTDRTATYQRAYQRLRNDFQQVRNRPVRDTFGDPQPALRGDADTRVEFTRAGWRNPLFQPRPGLERVSYHLVDKELRRESYRVLDQAQDSKLVTLTLVDHVDEMRLRYMNANREWSNVWPPLSSAGAVQTDSVAPLAVEITLKTQDWGDLVYLFRLGIDGVSAAPPVAPPTVTP